MLRFSPLSGDCLFLTVESDSTDSDEVLFQSPQRGLFISYTHHPLLAGQVPDLGDVSVPSAGIVYFLHVL